MTTPPGPTFDRVVRVERNRLLRREEFVILLALDRVFLQFGGSVGRADGWLVRSVVDPGEAATEPLEMMLADYLRQRFRQVPVDLSTLPPFPDELLDPVPLGEDD